MEPESKAFETEIQNYQFLEKHHTEIDTAFEAKDYRKALFHVDQSLNIGVASKRLKVKKAECLAYLGKNFDLVGKTQGVVAFLKLVGRNFNGPLSYQKNDGPN